MGLSHSVTLELPLNTELQSSNQPSMSCQESLIPKGKFEWKLPFFKDLIGYPVPFAVKQQVTSSKIHLLVLSPHLKLKFCISPISELWVVVALNESTAGADGIDWNNGMGTIQVVLAHCSDGWSLVLFILQEFLCLFASQSCFSSVFLWTPHGHWETKFAFLTLPCPHPREGNVELQQFLQVVFCILHFSSAFFAYFNSAISVKKKTREKEILSQRKENHLGIKLFLQFREKTF